MTHSIANSHVGSLPRGSAQSKRSGIGRCWRLVNKVVTKREMWGTGPRLTTVQRNLTVSDMGFDFDKLVVCLNLPPEPTPQIL